MQIVSNQSPKTRQSQVVAVCVFLCLALPAISASDMAGEQTGRDEATSIDRVSIPGNPEHIAQRRVEMDFLLGTWDVSDTNHNSIGVSTFAYERSGKMIREDWIAANGASAQGVTFFDPNENCWKMTWVDSSGVIMESAGHWSGETLTLEGFMTSKDGRRAKAQSTLNRQDEDTLSLELQVEIDGKLKTISQSSYRRVETNEANG